MAIDKYNAERYYDPTTYEALTNVINEERKARYRPLVYICFQSSGILPKDIGMAKMYSRFAVDNKAIPISSDLLLSMCMEKEIENDTFLFIDNVLLGKCEELWVFGTNITDEMKYKITRSKRKNKQVRYFTDECKEVV